MVRRQARRSTLLYDAYPAQNSPYEIANPTQISQAKKQTSEIDARLEAYRRDAEKNIEKYSKEANKEFNSAVNKFDKTVEDGIARAKGEVKEGEAKAKSTWGSWFGGK